MVSNVFNVSSRVQQDTERTKKNGHVHYQRKKTPTRHTFSSVVPILIFKMTGHETKRARIDFIAFTAERHGGNKDHMRQYLEWEINLVNQLDEQERGVFTVLAP